MIFEKCGFDTKSYFFLCFAALQNACFCLCLDRRKSVEKPDSLKNTKKRKKTPKKSNSTEFRSARRRFGRHFGILVNIFGRHFGRHMRRIYIYILYVWSVM